VRAASVATTPSEATNLFAIYRNQEGNLYLFHWGPMGEWCFGKDYTTREVWVYGKLQDGEKLPTQIKEWWQALCLNHEELKLRLGNACVWTPAIWQYLITSCQMLKGW